MTPAVALLTILFVGSDPQAPVIAVEVAQEGSARRISWLLLGPAPAAPAPTTAGDAGTVDVAGAVAQAPFAGVTGELSDRRGGGVLDWPQAPRGGALVAAADGLVLTIDDAGAWQDGLKLAQRPAQTTTVVPVAAPQTLRIFVVEGVDGAVSAATLQGTRVRYEGFALVSRRLAPALGLVVEENAKPTAKLLADGGPFVFVSDEEGCSARVPLLVAGPRVQARRQGAPLCGPRFLAAHLTGVWLTESRDVAVRGFVLVRR